MSIEVFGECLPQSRVAEAGCVFGKAGLQSIDSGFFDVLGRVKIRFACAETAHVNAFSLHRFGFAIDRESERGSQLGGAFGNFHGGKLIQNGSANYWWR